MAAFDHRRVARIITAIESGGDDAKAIIRDAYRDPRPVPVVGITGPPGAGKSTLIDRLAVQWANARSENVAVLAVDPSSPFSDGALLGDRIRMNEASSHPRVFVRSLASRGKLGGLNAAATDIVMALGKLGFDRVLVETVGAGQTDVSIATVADAVLVMTVPGLGDQIQAAKAGILEIGDIYVVNKCDLPGAAEISGHLESQLDLVYPGSPGANHAPVSMAAAPRPGSRDRHTKPADAGNFWRPPVLSVSALDGGGVAALTQTINDFLAWSRAAGLEQVRMVSRVKARILGAAMDRLMQRCLATQTGSGCLEALVAATVSGAQAPDQAVDELIESLLRRAE